jgi:hypothetical protein
MRTRTLAALALAALALKAADGRAQCHPRLADVTPGMFDDSTVPPTFVVTGNGRIDVADAVVALRAAVALQTLAYAPDPCLQRPGDVTPGLLDDTTTPATWIPTGDGRWDVADVVIILRAAVGLTTISDGLTYFADAKVIMDDRCTRCHVAGGIGPFPLTSHAEVSSVALAVREALRARVMPPWPPSSACAPLLFSRALDTRDWSVLVSWLEQGWVEGDPGTEPPPRPGPPPVMFDTRLVMAEPYTPDGAVSDDYRCFVLDWPHAMQRFVTGVRVDPDRADLVHHVIAFGVLPTDVPGVLARDAADPGPGYTCFGGPGGGTYWLGAWAPGDLGNTYPEGTGIRVLQGSRVVMQVHYNMDSVPAGPDRSAVEMVTASAVDRRALIVPVPAAELFIPAGDPDVSHEQTFTSTQVAPAVVRLELGVGPTDPVQVHGVGLHLHQLGTRTSAALVPPVGSEECLLDITDWDFHWQGSYRLAEPTLMESADFFRVRCAWDNSPANQPYVGGEQQDPVDVTWGEGSRDEMCLAILYMTAP